ncbi:MAG: tetratricopeptide repeat protein, partial [Gemmatimonadetes bacterium]|nr:tetratricopeptide repeat protein [Gemmatimonadota bacterium]
FMFVDNYLPESGPFAGAEIDPASFDVELDEPPSTAEPTSPEDEDEQRAVLPNSVAVLPFDNLSPDPDDAYFAIGLHDEILSQLAKLSNLSVISRTSMLRYADSDLSIPEIARELNVGTVMEGSVRYADNRVRITTQLIDAATDEHLWSETYEREFSDIFAIESDIAMNIANALEAEFSLAEQESIDKQSTNSPEAYAFYLRAISGASGPGVPAIIYDLEQAIRLDPEFALAYAAAANWQSISLLGFGASSPTQAAELERRAQDNAERALALDSTLGSAHAALANIHTANWRGVAAREAFERALQYSPNDANLLTEYARLKRYRGEYAEAIGLMQRAVELDPNNPNRLLNLGVAYRYARDYGSAAATFRRGLELAPAVITLHINLARAEVALGNSSEALRQLSLIETLFGEDRPNTLRLTQMAVTYSQAGRSDQAMRLFNELEERALEEPVGEASWVRANIAIGDYEQALQYLESAIRERVPTDVGTLAELAANAIGDPALETDPRFQELFSRLWDDG